MKLDDDKEEHKSQHQFVTFGMKSISNHLMFVWIVYPLQCCMDFLRWATTNDRHVSDTIHVGFLATGFFSLIGKNSEFIKKKG